MRFTLAGIVLLAIFGAAPQVRAQAEGKVLGIGLGANGWYRPNCWVPMRLELTPTSGESETYKIGIRQEDLDKDKVLFSRPFTLTGNTPDGTAGAGGARRQEVWVYFRPQPRDFDQTPGQLADAMQIFLYKGEQQLVRIPFKGRTTLNNLDAACEAGTRRGNKLVLMVGNWQEENRNGVVDPYNAAADDGRIDRGVGTRGVNETPIFADRVSIGELPTNSIGYESVDAVVLFGGAHRLPEATLAALEDWVRDGGKLVVCQGRDWQKTRDSALAALLPVVITEGGEEPALRSLNQLAGFPDFEQWWAERDDPRIKLAFSQKDVPAPWEGFAKQVVTKRDNLRRPVETEWRPDDPWEPLRGRSYPLAKASLREGAVVNQWCADDPSSPYLARWVVGLGSVTWVAQDLGSPLLKVSGEGMVPERAELGWPRIWDRVFDWPNNTRTVQMSRARPTDWGMDHEKKYRDTGFGEVADLSYSMLGGMEHGGRGAGYVAIAVLFFIGYWVVAGPGGYFFLLARKRAHYSWVLFGICAVVATGLTVLIVKLVLRGPPEVKHVTIVRVAPDGEAVAWSNFGLYIPRDGYQEIELKETLAKRASFVTPYPEHPALRRTEASDVPAYLEYEIPVRERTSDEAKKVIRVPYRSTLKKFQAKWTGMISGRVTAKDPVQLSGEGDALKVVGTLVNETGVDLHNVYFAFVDSFEQMPGSVGAPPPERDTLWHLPDGIEKAAWASGQALDLADLAGKLDLVASTNNPARKPGMIGDKGRLNLLWGPRVFHPEFKNRQESYMYENTDRAVLLMSIFDRFRPSESTGDSDPRYELHRHAGRHIDASHAIASGYLLVLARSAGNSPLPFPMRVAEIERVGGEGVVYWQFLIPVKRDKIGPEPKPPTTRPATRPATGPATKPAEDVEQ